MISLFSINKQVEKHARIVQKIGDGQFGNVYEVVVDDK